MSGMRLEDLPAGRLRKAAIEAIARDELERSRTMPETAAPAPRRRSEKPARRTWRCARCGHAETAYKAAERHADTERHCRIELELEAVC